MLYYLLFLPLFLVEFNTLFPFPLISTCLNGRRSSAFLSVGFFVCALLKTERFFLSFLWAIFFPLYFFSAQLNLSFEFYAWSFNDFILLTTVQRKYSETLACLIHVLVEQCFHIHPTHRFLDLLCFCKFGFGSILCKC